MVDLAPDEIPMPQGRLDLLSGSSGKAYIDWLQARGDEFGDGRVATSDPFHGWKNADVSL